MSSSPPALPSTSTTTEDEVVISSDNPPEKINDKGGSSSEGNTDNDDVVDDEPQKTTTKTAAATDVNEEDETETETNDSNKKQGTSASSIADGNVCKFRVSGISYGTERAEDFDVVLLPSVHGLYDLVDAVFRHSLTEFTNGWTISSRMWKIDYGHETFASMVTEELYEFEDKKPVVCDSLHRCIFASAEMTKVAPLNNDSTTRGEFRLDHRPLEFRFKKLAKDTNETTTIDVNDPDVLKEHPKCIPMANAIKYTANVGATDYVSKSQEADIQELSESFVNFFQGLNSWSELGRRSQEWMPAKPVSPIYSRIEAEIIGLFINAGWKFANSYKSGLKYAMPHRAKAGLQMKWYYFAKKNHYQVECIGRGLSNDRKIIRAKKLCKELMEEMLELHTNKKIIKPIPQPKKRTYEDMFRDDPRSSRFDSRYAVEKKHLPKRLRSVNSCC